MCLSSSKVWVKQLWRWQSNDGKTFKMANRGEGFPQRKDTFPSPPSPQPRGSLMSDGNCTPVTNITPALSLGAGSVGRSGPGAACPLLPTRAPFSWGFSRRFQRKQVVNHWAGSFWVKAEDRVITQLSPSRWRELRAQERANPHEFIGGWGKQEPRCFALPLCPPKAHREAIHRGGCR